MLQFTVTLSASDPDEAAERTLRYLARCSGEFAVVATRVRSVRSLLVEVAVEATGDVDRNDVWVVLTSYGMSPSVGLGSDWEAFLGASA